MTLPVATRLITVLRADGLEARDSYDPPAEYLPVASDVRAVISRPRGAERTTRAEAETATALLTCDPIGVGLTHLDRVLDDQGVTWEVEWCQLVTGLGLDHHSAGLIRFDGQQP